MDNIWCSFPRIHGIGNHRVDMKVNPLPVNCDDPLEEFLLPSPTSLGFTGWEVLVPKGITLPLVDTTMIPPET